GDGGERGERHRRLPYQPALGLPHRLEAALLGVADVVHPVPDGVLVLQVQRHPPGTGHGHATHPPSGLNGCGPSRSSRSHSRAVSRAACAAICPASTRVGLPSAITSSPATATSLTCRDDSPYSQWPARLPASSGVGAG